MTAPFIQAHDVEVKRGGKKVLQIPSLVVPPNQVTVVLGDNGAGKSTLLLATAGLMDLAAGEISMFGRPFHKGRAPASRASRRQLAIVLQDPYLFGTDARSNIIHGLKLHGVAKNERNERVAEAISMLAIADLEKRNAQELSGGERKLVALARAIALRPKALLLDEVTASLDDSARDRVLAAIGQLVQGGTSVMMATHIRTLAQRLDAQCIEIVDGTLRQYT